MWFEKEIQSSKHQNYDINRIIIYRIRSCVQYKGAIQEHFSVQTFPRLMNVPVIYVKCILKDVPEVANETMLDHVLRMKIETEPLKY